MNPYYNGLLTFLTLVYTVLLYAADISDETIADHDYAFLEIPSIVLSVVYLVDLITNYICLGPRKIWEERKILIFETVL